MPLELGIWRIDDEGMQGGRPGPVHHAPLDLEDRLEDLLEKDISIADPEWLVIGRQVMTAGGPMDLLAIDKGGNLVALELKRDRTPRDIVSQALDYGSWLVGRENDHVMELWDTYVKRRRPDLGSQSLDEAFRARFGVNLPEELNENHQLVLVASSFDPSTERIVAYLREHHGVPINAVFFRVYKDEGREYLTRAWMVDPGEAAELAAGDGRADAAGRGWNNETYVNFGEGGTRSWEDARRYGFVCGGMGPRYSNAIRSLCEGERVWVNVPGPTGYVGVGRVTGEACRADEFMATIDGQRRALRPEDVAQPGMFQHADDPELAEYLAPVDWIRTVPISEAVYETGFFGNQNVVARPESLKWERTVQRLKTRFGVAD